MTSHIATVDHPVMDVVQNRWSPCVFSDRVVTSQKLRSLLEAARWAPSSYNEQPWRFILGIKGQGEAYDLLFRCLVESNQQWAQTAPVLGLSVAHMNFARNGKPNKHAVHDVGLAMGQMILEAVAQGLCVHQMAGYQASEAVELLHISPDHQPVAAFAIGYVGDVAKAPDALRQRDEAPRERFEQDKFVFEGAFGQKWEA